MSVIEGLNGRGGAMAVTGLMQLLDRDAWFAALPCGLREEMVRSSVVRRLNHGDPGYAIDGPPDGLHTVLQGALYCVRFAPNGKIVMCLILRPPEWFGALSEFDGTGCAMTATAYGPTMTLHLPHRSFQRLVTDEPRHYLHFARLLARQLQRAVGALASTKSVPLRSRVAYALLELVESLPCSENPATPISQDTIAAMVGVSRQTISKIVNAWSRDGVLKIRYRAIEVRDRAALQRISDSAD